MHLSFHACGGEKRQEHECREYGEGQLVAAGAVVEQAGQPAPQAAAEGVDDGDRAEDLAGREQAEAVDGEELQERVEPAPAQSEEGDGGPQQARVGVASSTPPTSMTARLSRKTRF